MYLSDEAERILGNEVLNKMLDSGMLQRSDSAGLTCVVAHDLIAAVIAAYADVSRPPSQAPEAITILKEGMVPARPSVAASAPDEQVAVAKALVDEGIRLRTLSRGKEEIAVYDDVLARLAPPESQPSANRSPGHSSTKEPPSAIILPTTRQRLQSSTICSPASALPESQRSAKWSPCARPQGGHARRAAPG